MARVNVEQYALTDPRYSVLGSLIGVDQWSALGRMLVIWNQCQERESYVLTVDIVNCMFSDVTGLAEALLKSGLGKKHRHGIYISGTKGRIEWLAKKRVTARLNGPKGGRPKTTEKEPTENRDRFLSETPVSVAVAPAQKTIPPSAVSKRSAKDEVENLTLGAHEREWCASKAPGFDADDELEAFKERLRGNGYRTNAGPVKDAWATFQTHMRNAVKFSRRAPSLQRTLPRISKPPAESEVLQLMNEKAKR